MRRDALPGATTPRTWRLVVPGQPLSPNRATTMSLRVRMRDTRMYREMVAYQTQEVYNGPPLEQARVTVTLVRRGGPPLDQDNAYSTVKHLIDGLCVAHGGRLLVDDDAAHLVTLDVRQERGAARCCVLDIEEVV